MVQLDYTASIFYKTLRWVDGVEVFFSCIKYKPARDCRFLRFIANYLALVPSPAYRKQINTAHFRENGSTAIFDMA
jgi:hypothetical protein